MFGILFFDCSSMSSSCSHSKLTFQPSSNASIAGYTRLDASKLAAATTTSGRVSKSVQTLPPLSTSPTPLVLPGDDLANDPKQPGQTVRSWTQLKSRNQVTARQKTIYVVDSTKSDTTPLGDRLEAWAKPRVGKVKAIGLRKPATQDVVEYLEAFYHGMTVKQADDIFRFISWEDEVTSKSPDTFFIGLTVKSEAVRIRTRPCPDQMFLRQLNLNDLLDACMSALPPDAFSLVLMTDQDLYEDEEDDFCCGRAYGGSRVAVVSTARYHPALDEVQDVERLHAWPASHCAWYVEACCSETTRRTGTKDSPIDLDEEMAETVPESPMQAALLAYTSAPSVANSKNSELLAGLWLARVCRTVSHELGHCFGIGHCTYYACSMQSTASVSEDVRQPPYLCPVDLIKVLRATGVDEIQRYRALVGFCQKHKDVQMFQAFGAWTEALLKGKVQT